MDRAPSRSNHPGAEFNRALQSPSAAEAIGLLLGAAQAGCRRAQFLAGLAYHIGRGVAVDYHRAGAWYRMAAGSGDSYAMANLGVMCLLGQGAPADDLDAYAWVQSAVGLGHQWLRPALDLLERRVTGAAEIAGGERIIASVSPEIPAFRACNLPECDPSRCNVG